MLRRLFTFLSVVSLLLCLAACAMWGRSHAGWEYAYAIGGRWGVSAVFDTGRATLKVIRYQRTPVMAGRIGFSLAEDSQAQSTDPSMAHDGDQLLSEWSDSPPTRSGGFGGGIFEGYFRYLWHRQAATTPPDFRFRWIAMPSWLLAAGLAVLPAIRFRKHLRIGSRHAPGCCSRCGYDLRATPDRCPECGMEP